MPSGEGQNYQNPCTVGHLEFYVKIVLCFLGEQKKFGNRIKENEANETTKQLLTTGKTTFSQQKNIIITHYAALNDIYIVILIELTKNFDVTILSVGEKGSLF